MRPLQLTKKLIQHLQVSIPVLRLNDQVHQYSSRLGGDTGKLSHSVNQRSSTVFIPNDIHNIRLLSHKLFSEYPHLPITFAQINLREKSKLSKFLNQIFRFRHLLWTGDGNPVQFTVIDTNTVRSIHFLHYNHWRRIR